MKKLLIIPVLTILLSTPVLALEIKNIVIIIIAFLLILFIMYLLFRAMWSSGTTHTGGKTKNPTKDPTKEPIKNPDKIPDYIQILIKIEELIKKYKSIFENFKIYCNFILQTHYEFMISGGYYGTTKPPVSSHQWNLVFESIKELTTIDVEIKSFLMKITSDTLFDKIIKEQKISLINLKSQKTEMIKIMQEYHLDFLHRYNSALPPA